MRVHFRAQASSDIFHACARHSAARFGLRIARLISVYYSARHWYSQAMNAEEPIHDRWMLLWMIFRDGAQVRAVDTPLPVAGNMSRIEIEQLLFEKESEFRLETDAAALEFVHGRNMSERSRGARFFLAWRLIAAQNFCEILIQPDALGRRVIPPPPEELTNANLALWVAVDVWRDNLRTLWLRPLSDLLGGHPNE